MEFLFLICIDINYFSGRRSCRSQRAEQLKAQGKGETSHISAKPVLTHSKYYDFLPHPSRTKRNHYIFSTSACQFNSRATATHPPPLNLNMWALAYEGNSRSCFQLWRFPQPPLQESFTYVFAPLLGSFHLVQPLLQGEPAARRAGLRMRERRRPLTARLPSAGGAGSPGGRRRRNAPPKQVPDTPALLSAI